MSFGIIWVASQLFLKNQMKKGAISSNTARWTYIFETLLPNFHLFTDNKQNQHFTIWLKIPCKNSNKGQIVINFKKLTLLILNRYVFNLQLRRSQLLTTVVLKLFYIISYITVKPSWSQQLAHQTQSTHTFIRPEEVLDRSNTTFHVTLFLIRLLASPIPQAARALLTNCS